MPENFFYNDTYYHNLEDLAADLEDILEETSDSEVVEINLSDEAPIVKLSPDWIMSRIDDDAFCEETLERDLDRIKKVLLEHIDFEKLNAKIPTLFYGNHKKLTITVAELKAYL